jgi:outer membrane receptor protein involved in Fe transport
MTLKRKKLRDAIAFALVMGASSVTGTAFAQETPATPAATDQEKAAALDTIVVTGTRIQSQSVTASSPVAEIQAEEFQFAGATRVDDLINQYPQMSPYFDSFANNGALGYPVLDLRGLGPQRTLTLVNGNRLPPGASEFRDISIVPASLVKRVDLLTGGASAVYGSDAIAGVVNFILDTEFEGVSLSAGYSAYQHNNDSDYMQQKLTDRGFAFPDGDSGFDGVSNNIDLSIGSSFADGRGHAMAWLTWRKNEALFQGQRDYSSCALTADGVDIFRSNGTLRRNACGGSATNAAGDFYFYQPGVGGSSASLAPDGSWLDHYGAPYNYAPINYYQRPDERYTFGANIKYEINEHFRPYLDLMYINKKDAIQVAESGAFFELVPNIDCTDPLIGTACADLGFDPADGPLNIYVAKRNVEGGPRHFASETASFRAVAGIEGAISDNWSYNASFIYGQTTNTIIGTGDFLSDRILKALLGCQPGNTFDGCIFYDVWHPNSVTAEAAAALQGVSILNTQTSLKSFNAYVTGDLGFGFGSAKGDNLSLVVGTEWREENYDFIADSNSAAGNFSGSGGPSTPVSGKTSVEEIFLEGQIPILKDVGIFKSWGVELGYRHSDYNLSGGADTYKIGSSMDFGMVRIRGGFNHALRAPGIIELFNPQSIALFGGTDPCAGATPTFTLAQCQNTGVSAAKYGLIAANPAAQYNQFIGGNQNLAPEEADTWTFGVVFTPFNDLRITLDWYDIKIEDTIGTVGAQTILNFCGQTGDPTLCSLVHRRPGTEDLWRGSDPSTSGFVTNINGNFGETEYEGLDLGINYGWDMIGGRFTTTLQGTYLLKQENSPLAGVDPVIVDLTTYDCVGEINSSCQAPKWRHIASLRYSRDWFTVNLRWRYYGEMDYVDAVTDVPLVTDKLVCDPSNVPAGASAATQLAWSHCSGDQTVHAVNYFDLSASALIGEWGELTVGVNNVADKAPPLVGASLAANANSPGGYDQAGRFFFANFTVKF